MKLKISFIRQTSTNGLSFDFVAKDIKGYQDLTELKAKFSKAVSDFQNQIDSFREGAIPPSQE